MEYRDASYTKNLGSLLVFLCMAALVYGCTPMKAATHCDREWNMLSCPQKLAHLR